MIAAFPLAACLTALGLGLVLAVFAVRCGEGALGRRVVETFCLSVVGALLARGFVAALIALGGDDEAAVTTIGLLIFIWPGAVNLIGSPLGYPLIGAEGLLWVAFAMGALTGFYDGLWATRDWRRLGSIEFLLDVTWGLAGSANGVLLHLVNLGWGDHARGEMRLGVHRYRRGFAPGPGFAFVQGAVMSNTGDLGPASETFRHEKIHIWQSRLAGPLFWFSYLGWIVLAFPPALVAAAVHRNRPLGEVVQWWTYYNNPWEVMAYGLANPAARSQRRFQGGDVVEPWVCWPWRTAIVLGALGGAVLLAAFLGVVWSAFG